MVTEVIQHGWHRWLIGRNIPGEGHIGAPWCPATHRAESLSDSLTICSSRFVSVSYCDQSCCALFTFQLWKCRIYMDWFIPVFHSHALHSNFHVFSWQNDLYWPMHVVLMLGLLVSGSWNPYQPVDVRLPLPACCAGNLHPDKRHHSIPPVNSLPASLAIMNHSWWTNHW